MRLPSFEGEEYVAQADSPKSGPVLLNAVTPGLWALRHFLHILPLGAAAD